MKNQASSQKKGVQAAMMKTPVSDTESDRRLRPVIEALYAHKTKQSMKLVQQAIQKRPGWPAARALRACIYLQMEKWHEAKQEIDELRSDLEEGRVPINEDAAKKIHMYYQEACREDLAGQIYELAWKAEMSELRLAETAFCLYIRGNAFSQAQKIATKMHRLASGRTQRFVFWATAALWLSVTYQMRSSAQAVSQTDSRMLKLGCAMMSKAFDASLVSPSAETVRFAMRVFKQSGDFESAIKLVSHPRLVMDDAEVLHLRGDIAFASTKDPTDYRTLLTNYAPNDWGYWLRYFESVKEQEGSVDDVESLINAVLQSEEKTKEPSRGGFLARMELKYRKQEWNLLVDAVIHYFEVFGDKAVVSRDLRPWLTLLKEQNLHNQTLDKLIEIGERRGFPHHLHLCWLKLWFDRLDDTSEQLVQRYSEQRVGDLETTERQPGDDYLLLVAHKLLPLTPSSDRYANMMSVLKTIVLLETGLKWSPCNHDFKLLLVRLYCVIGGMEKLSALWDSLDVKHVQLSTLTHIVLYPFFETGHHQPLQTVVENMDTLWREIDREIPECTTRAFQDGSLNAAVDFVLFKLRLERSVILAETMVIDAHLHLILNGGEPIGVHRALSSLTMQPKFTLDDLSGSKRIVSNEDTQCYRFWDYDNYDKNSRLDTLQDEFLEEGITCNQVRLQSLRADLASLLVLLRLTEANAREGLVRNSVMEEVDLQPIPEALLTNQDISLETRLRLTIAKNFMEIKSVFSYLRNVQTPDAHGHFETNSTVVKELNGRAIQLAREVLDLVENTLGDVDKKSDHDTFPRTLKKCCRITFNLLLLIATAVSSFGPVLAKSQRKVKKAGPKGNSKAHSTEAFESCRKAVLTYRDEIMNATSLIHDWVKRCIDNGLNWVETVYQSEEFGDLSKLIPEHLCHLDDERDSPRTVTLDRSGLCNEIVDSIRSSHSVSCSALLETLTAITRRLQLADL